MTGNAIFNSRKKLIVLIAALIVLIIIAIVVVIVNLSGNGNQDKNISGEGLYGSWVSDFSKCVVTVYDDGTVEEVNGASKATVLCSIDKSEDGKLILKPIEGKFLFANFYEYEEKNGQGYLTSFIYLDLQEQVREEYISYRKQAEE